MKPGPDFPAFQPLYRQIKALITQSLMSGEWRPGEPIPSEIDLASRFSVSQGTVRKAVSELAEEHVLVRQQGRGTFVASHAEERSQFPFLRMTPDEAELNELTAQLLDLRRVRDVASARLLGLTAGSSVFLLTRILRLNGTPICYEEVRLPASRFKGLTAAVVQQHECMLYSMYETHFGMRVLQAEERVKAVTAPTRWPHFSDARRERRCCRSSASPSATGTSLPSCAIACATHASITTATPSPVDRA